MSNKHLFMILALIAIIVAPLIMFNGLGEDEGFFGGADGAAEEHITVINPEYEPWFSSFWEPPSGEIESLLFALQAALGAIIIGYYIGYFKGLKKTEKSENE
ncbi:energy-coupling factor ABC transporter substrate-binding protein [Methanococcus voltae]|uniref:Cobalt transport protein CbiN n=2 Tax=Methanococcus voltae TaxID=2188 RepID=A0A8J7UTH9_METVO|nr:energy-coupling factor ABC transporter substrate-binding protein [Methanococcus voltae]MBP2172891.1 cobalt/nickel transport protein [Methanococcus voltae]MBP2201699.1 cobalt/nickel transport protein [Methanococcus voltae]MCS3922487.1 cobalt/nickel transport protein [Methanococcus voltae PS]